MSCRGWTLKQLLVVLVIMAALMVLVFPVFQIVRYRVLEAKCRTNLWTIYTKYKLMKQENGGRWNRALARELNQWLHRQEGLNIFFCPLSGENYDVPVANRYWDSSNLISKVLEGDFGLYLRENLVAWCPCHTRPPRPRCGRPYVGGACALLVLDIGDGKMEYGFTVYTKRLSTGEIIWPKENDRCPDPRWFPDVSKGY